MKISIITATYNSGKTLRDTLDSVLLQNYHEYELIIKDGGSKDNTLNICNEYLEKFEGKMHVISEPDKGIYDAMNQGINAACGDVIGILNSDDFFTATNILQNVAKNFEKYSNIDAIYGDVHYVSENETHKLVRYYSSKLFRRPFMRLGFMPAHPSFYCKKSIYEKYKLNGDKIEGFKGNPNTAYFNTTFKIAADFENLLRLIYVNRIRIKYINMDFVTMRIGGVSSSGIVSHKQIFKDHLRALKENGIYSTAFLLSLRYLYKLIELTSSRLKQ